MKYSIISAFVIIIMFLCNSTSYAQLLNPSFEDWNSLSPRYWHTVFVPGELEPVTRSDDAHHGNYSVKLETKEFAGTPYTGHIQSMDSLNTLGHPVMERYNALSGYYKFAPISSADLLIVVSVYSNSFALIGVGGTDIFNPADNWTQFNIPIDYFFDDPAASIIVSISIIDTSSDVSLSTVGSVAYIDNLALGGVTSVTDYDNISLNYFLDQNYPNPFNPTTKIEYSIPAPPEGITQSVQLLVYDALGREIEELVNENKEPGNYIVEWNALNRSSGVYFYQLVAGDFRSTKKMILMR